MKYECCQCGNELEVPDEEIEEKCERRAIIDHFWHVSLAGKIFCSDCYIKQFGKELAADLLGDN